MFLLVSAGKWSGVGAHFENLARKYVRSCGWCFLLVFVVGKHIEPMVEARSAVFLQILSIQVKDENELWRNAINKNIDTSKEERTSLR